MNTIPMTVEHQDLIRAGKKTTTLRAKKFPPGRYTCVSRGKVEGLEINLMPAGPVIFANLDKDKQQALIRTEGYETMGQFAAALQALRLDKILAGEPMVLHIVAPATQEAQHGV
jgi:hypothetical protein